MKRPTPQDFDIRIAADGSWYHEGGLIGRAALVKLFASVLRREDDGSYWLVTPVERGRITVEDVPFVMVTASFDGVDENQIITLCSNVGDEITLGESHELVMRQTGGGEDLRPYVSVRPGLEGRLARPVYYELAEASQPGPDGLLASGAPDGFLPLKATCHEARI